MWRLALGIFLSILPQRWRDALRLNESVPWEPATVLSSFVESLLALVLLLCWYSRSVTTWAANALDSALRGGPERAVPGQAIGFSALVLWILHPLTWLIALLHPRRSGSTAGRRLYRPDLRNISVGFCRLVLRQSDAASARGRLPPHPRHTRATTIRLFDAEGKNHRQPFAGTRRRIGGVYARR